MMRHRSTLGHKETLTLMMSFHEGWLAAGFAEVVAFAALGFAAAGFLAVAAAAALALVALATLVDLVVVAVAAAIAVERMR